MNIAVMGRRGMGKSTLARFIAERIKIRRNAHTILIFDPKRTFQAIPHTSDLGEFEEMITDTDFQEVAYQPLGIDEESRDMDAEFDAFFRALGVEYHLGLGEQSPRKNLSPVVLIVDEAWLLQQRGSMNPNLANLVRLADSENFYLIQAAHRPSDFGTATRSQLDEIYLFRQWLASDLDIIREWAGDDIAEKVATLPRFHVIRYEIGTQTFEVWDKPEAWYLKNGVEKKHVERSDDGSESSSGKSRASEAIPGA